MTRIYYFTRTGDSEKLALSITAQTGGTMFQIRNNKNWNGLIGFPPAVRTFVAEVGRNRIIAVPTSKGSHLSDQDGFAKVIEVIGADKSVRV